MVELLSFDLAEEIKSEGKMSHFGRPWYWKNVSGCLCYQFLPLKTVDNEDMTEETEVRFGDLSLLVMQI